MERVSTVASAHNSGAWAAVTTPLGTVATSFAAVPMLSMGFPALFWEVLGKSVAATDARGRTLRTGATAGALPAPGLAGVDTVGSGTGGGGVSGAVAVVSDRGCAGARRAAVL
jgi:hypothetical protein